MQNLNKILLLCNESHRSFSLNDVPKNLGQRQLTTLDCINNLNKKLLKKKFFRKSGTAKLKWVRMEVFMNTNREYYAF